MNQDFSLSRKLSAEFLGSALLLAIIVGSGIMGDQLSNGNKALALLANSIATGAGLSVLILMFSNISGAHFNPVVSLLEALQGKLSNIRALQYVLAQSSGAILGVYLAHVMFNENALTYSTRTRCGLGQYFAEFIATFGLIAVIRGVGTKNKSALPYAIGLYITSAYWFTSSTSFANPAVTLARSLTNTFAGIRPTDSLAFIAMQVFGALTAEYLFRWFYKQTPLTTPNN